MADEGSEGLSPQSILAYGALEAKLKIKIERRKGERRTREMKGRFGISTIFLPQGSHPLPRLPLDHEGF